MESDSLSKQESHDGRNRTHDGIHEVVELLIAFLVKQATDVGPDYVLRGYTRTDIPLLDVQSIEVSSAHESLLHQVQLVDCVLDALLILKDDNDDPLVLLLVTILGSLPLFLGGFQLLFVVLDAVHSLAVAFRTFAHPNHLWLPRNV